MTQTVNVPGVGPVNFPDGMGDAEISAAIQKNYPEIHKPKAGLTGKVPNWANETIATVGDSFLNAPTNAFNLLKAGVGTAATAMGKPDLAPSLTPTPDLVRRGFESAGFIRPGMEPEGTGERLLKAGVQGATSGLLNPASSLAQAATTAAVSGGSAALGRGVSDATDNETLGVVAGMAAPMGAQAAINSARAKRAQMEMLESQNAVKDKTLADARKEGYVVPPTTQNPSFINNRLESMGGKAAIKQEASLRNQQVTNRLAAKELGLPEGTAITEGTLNEFRNKVSAPYREVAAISKTASTVLEKLKEARADANAYHRHADISADPRSLKEAKAFDAKATMYEKALDAMAVRAGKPKLVQEMRDARMQIAKSYDIERGLNIGDADVSAPSLGRSLDKGKKLSGNLKTIARFAQGPGRQFVTEGARIPSPGVSALEPYGMMGMGLGGAALAGPGGAAVAGLPLLRGPIRNMLLSNSYQNIMGSPTYSPGGLAGLLGVPPQQTDLATLFQSISAGRVKE